MARQICIAITLTFLGSALLGSTFLNNAHAVAPTTTNSKSVADAGTKSKATPKQNIQADKEAERSATGLVNEHLPELKKLLETLKKDNPRQYEAAIRDLAKSAKRLRSIQNRDEELFEIEVEMLQTRSSVKLLTAKLKVRDNESDRDLLRNAAKRMHNAELAKAKYNIRYSTEKFEKAQQQLAAAKKRLESIEGQSESRLEKTYLSFLKNAGRQEKPTKQKKKP